MKIKYDDFGEVICKQLPKLKRQFKKMQYLEAYKLFGKALF